MRNMQFVPNFRIVEAIAQGNRSAGSSNVNGVSLDCQNDSCVVALVEFGAITAGAVTSLQWEGSDDGSTWAALDSMNTPVAADDDNQYFVTELHKPLNRYNRIVVRRATQNATIRSAQYIVGGARKVPTNVDGDAGHGDGYGVRGHTVAGAEQASGTYNLSQFIGGQGEA